MKKMDNKEIDICLDDFPDNFIKLIIALLNDKDYSEKHNARITLVKKGKDIIPHIHKLLDSENSLLRMEAAKIAELIADRKSIPVLIDLLEDTETGIRWIAAEGLIRIGRQSISPLLRSIRNSRHPIFLYHGAHHVLAGLLHEKERNKFLPLLHSLENYNQMGENAPIEASKTLKTVYK